MGGEMGEPDFNFHGTPLDALPDPSAREVSEYQQGKNSAEETSSVWGS